MCRESYPDIDQHNIDIDTVEKEWPKFHEQSGQTIAQEPVTWGAERIGRMPPSIWDDGAAIRTSNGSHDGRTPESYADCLSAQPYANAGGACVGQSGQEAVYAALKEEAVGYTQRFNRALQHNQERVQHHIHRKQRDGKRAIPNACQAKKNPKLCNHDFPDSPNGSYVRNRIIDRRGMQVLRNIFTIDNDQIVTSFAV